MATVERKPERKVDYSPVIFSAVAEAVCIAGGAAAYLLTRQVVWLAVGVAVGASLFVPGLLRFVSDRKERDRAAR